MNNPYVRVLPGPPDERTINETLAEATVAGAKLVSLTVFGETGRPEGTVLLFEAKVEGRRRVPNDTSAV